MKLETIAALARVASGTKPYTAAKLAGISPNTIYLALARKRAEEPKGCGCIEVRHFIIADGDRVKESNLTERYPNATFSGLEDVIFDGLQFKGLLLKKLTFGLYAIVDDDEIVEIVEFRRVKNV